jgi:hypothetical protein
MADLTNERTVEYTFNLLNAREPRADVDVIAVPGSAGGHLPGRRASAPDVAVSCGDSL